MFDNQFLSCSKQLKLVLEIIFSIKQEDICDYNPWCFLPIGLMIETIITNLYSDITEQKNISAEKDLFSKIKDDKIYLYQRYLQNFL